MVSGLRGARADCDHHPAESVAGGDPLGHHWPLAVRRAEGGGARVRSGAVRCGRRRGRGRRDRARCLRRQERDPEGGRVMAPTTSPYHWTASHRELVLLLAALIRSGLVTVW